MTKTDRATIKAAMAELNDTMMKVIDGICSKYGIHISIDNMIQVSMCNHVPKCSSNCGMIETEEVEGVDIYAQNPQGGYQKEN